MKKNVNTILAVLLTLVLVFGNTLSVLAHQQFKNEGSLPAEVRHLPRLKVAPAKSGTYSSGDGLTVSLTLHDDRLTLDWETTAGSVPVMYVFVFGGDEGNLYSYSGGSNGDSNLVAPLGKKANHVSFYYETEQQTSMLTVKHLEQGTNTELATEETHVQVVGTTLTVDAISISGYIQVEPTSHTHTFGTADAEHIFYYAPVGTTLTVKYMIQGTTTEIAEPQTHSGTFNQQLPVSAINISGYTPVEPTSHTHTFGTTDAEHIFYYAPVGTTLTVKYMTQGTTTEIAEPQTHSGTFNQQLPVSAINIPGYTPVEPTSHTHTFGTTDAEHIFYYAPVGTTLTVKYMTQGTTTEIAEPQTHSGTFNQQLPVSAINIPGYTPVEPTSHTHTFGTTDAEHIFYYAPVGTTLTVKYMTQGTTTEIAEPQTHSGTFNQQLPVSAINISGYTPVEPTSHTHTFGTADAEHIFYYAPVGTTLTVKYMTQGTTTEIAEPQTHSGTFNQQLPVSAINISGYTPVEPTSHTHTFGATDAEHIFYYAPVEAGLTVRYVVQGSDPELLLGQEDYSGQAGQVVRVEVPPTIIKDELHYGLVPGQELGEPFDHTLGSGYQTLTLYYQGITSKLTVKHLVYDTTTELTPSKDYEGIVGSKLTVSAQSFSGYTLRSGTSSSHTHTFATGDATHIFEYTRVQEPPPVTYEYTLTVRYILDGTDIELRDHVSHTVDEGRSVTVTAPAIPGYVLKEGEQSSVTYTLYSNREHVFLYQEDIPLEPPIEEPPVEEPPVEEPPVEEPPLPPELPVTGGIDAAALYAVGALLTLTGLSIRRKKSRS